MSRADSLEGLRKLTRERPDDWPEIIWRCTPSVKATVKDPHLGALLRTRANVRCMPTSTQSSGTLRPKRAAAARATAYAGRTRESAVDDEWLREFEVTLATSIPEGRSSPLGDATIKQTVSLVRRLVIDFRTARGLDVRLTSCPAGLPRPERRPSRPTPSPQVLSWLLAELSAEERVIVALIVSCNLREGSVLGLREVDLDFASGLVVAAPSKVPGRPKHLVARYGYLTGWTRDFLLDHRPRLDRQQAGRLLFPNRNDATRPRTSVNPALRRACERLFGPMGPRYTTEDLRRLYQAVARGHEVPSTVVRGTSSMLRDIHTRRLVLPPEAVHAERLALRWDELCGAAAWRLAPVPRRSPEGTGPLEPEPLSTRRERIELPARAQPAGPPPSPPPTEGPQVPPRPARAPARGRSSRWGRSAWGPTGETRGAGAREVRLPSAGVAVETTPEPPPQREGSRNRPARGDGDADTGAEADAISELRDQLATVRRRERDTKAELQSLRREVQSLARLAHAPRQPAPPRVGDVLMTAGLAAAGIKAWDHREELTEALDEFLTHPGGERLALGDGSEPNEAESAAGPALAGSPAQPWPPPGDHIRYGYVDFSSDGDLG